MNQGHRDTEADLLGRVARRDTRAFEALYDRYSAAIYSLALGVLRDRQAAQEVTQEVFLDIWRQAGRFEPRLGTPRTWILSVAHHKSVDALRRGRLRAVEPLPEEMPHDPDVGGLALRMVEAAGVRDALGALADGQREAIVLAYYGGYTQQEIAARLDVPLGTVKTRMRDGLLRLRGLLRRERGEGAR